MLPIFDQDNRLDDMKALLDVLPLGVILLDRTVSVRLVNTVAATILKSRAELRVAGPTIKVRRTDERVGFTEAVRSVFTTGTAGSFAFCSRTGLPEVVIDLRLVRSVDLVIAVIQTVHPDAVSVTAFQSLTTMQSTVALMQEGAVPVPAVPESLPPFTLPPEITSPTEPRA